MPATLVRTEERRAAGCAARGRRRDRGAHPVRHSVPLGRERDCGRRPGAGRRRRGRGRRPARLARSGAGGARPARHAVERRRRRCRPRDRGVLLPRPLRAADGGDGAALRPRLPRPHHPVRLRRHPELQRRRVLRGRRIHFGRAHRAHARAAPPGAARRWRHGGADRLDPDLSRCCAPAGTMRRW